MKLSNGNPNGQIHSVNHSVNLPPSRFLANTGSGSSVTIEMLQKIFLVLFARKNFVFVFCNCHDNQNFAFSFCKSIFYELLTKIFVYLNISVITVLSYICFVFSTFLLSTFL